MSVVAGGGRAQRTRRALLTRPRLNATLDRLTPLTVIVGPRRAGKSVLVQTWLASPGVPQITVAAPPETPAGCSADQFWGAVAAALGAEPMPDAFSAVSDLLAGLSEDLLLVLDHPDRAADRELSTRLRTLLRGSRRLRVVVCTRDRGLAGELAAPGVESERIGWRDLLFTPEETAGWLCGGGVELPDSLVAAVREYVGGMPRLVNALGPVAWRFAGLDVAATLDVIDETVLSLIMRDVLQAGVAAGAAVLLGRAELGSLSEEAIAELWEAEGRTTRWGDLVDLGLTPSPSPDGGPASAPRLAPALRSAARVIPADQLPGRVRELIGMLGRGQLRRGDAAGAVRCALRVGDWELGWSVLCGHWALLAATDLPLLREVLGRLPQEWSRRDSDVATGQSLFTGLDAGFAASPCPGDPTEGIFTEADGTPRPLAAVISTGTVRLLSVRTAGEVAQSAELAKALIARVDAAYARELRDVAAFLAQMRLQWAMTLQLAGDLPGSGEQFRRAALEEPSDADGRVARWAVGCCALNDVLAGEPLRAESLAALAYDHTAGAETPRYEVPGHAAKVLWALQTMDMEGARRELAALDDAAESEIYWAPVVFARALMALALGSPEIGLDLLRRGEAAHPRQSPDGSLARTLIDGAAANLYLSAGRGNEAQAIVDGAATMTAALRICQARIRLLCGDPATARAQARGVATSRDCAPLDVISALLISAAAEAELGEGESARDSLDRALDLASATGQTGLLLSLPRGWQSRLAAAGVASAELCEIWDDHDRVRLFPDRIELVALTGRERIVLQQLAEGLSAAEMAEALFVTVDTVKSQLRSAYRKLGVNNRDEAVRAARRLRLI